MIRPVKSIFLIAVCLIFLIACDSPADRSIFNTLTLDELKDLTSKEPDFEKKHIGSLKRQSLIILVKTWIK